MKHQNFGGSGVCGGGGSGGGGEIKHLNRGGGGGSVGGLMYFESIPICEFFGVCILPIKVPQLKPIYSEVQLHSNPIKLSATVQVPPFSQGSSTHGSPVKK